MIHEHVPRDQVTIAVNRFNAPILPQFRSAGWISQQRRWVTAVENETEKLRHGDAARLPSRSVATRPISWSSSVEGASVLMIRIGDPVIYLPPPLPPLIRAPCTESLFLEKTWISLLSIFLKFFFLRCLKLFSKLGSKMFAIFPRYLTIDFLTGCNTMERFSRKMIWNITEENSSRNWNQPMLYFSGVSISIFPQQGASRKRCFFFLCEILHQTFATSSRSLIHFRIFLSRKENSVIKHRVDCYVESSLRCKISVFIGWKLSREGGKSRCGSHHFNIISGSRVRWGARPRIDGSLEIKLGFISTGCRLEYHRIARNE